MDNIGMFLTSLKNASQAGNEKVDISSSGVRIGVANVLAKTGYIRSFKVANDGKAGLMRVYLKYEVDGRPTLSEIRRQSTPGKRTYISANEIQPVRAGFGIAILSTNKGILSGDQAKSENVGGELICTVW